MLTLYLVRHGQTLFNSRDLVQGWVDSPLTTLGWRQARAVADHLADRPLTAVYASTSERAADTAQEIARRHEGLAVNLRKGFKEMYFGDLEARPNAEFFELVDDPRAFFADVMVGRGEAVAGGEPPAEYRTRVDAAVADLLADHDDGEVVLVSHGLTINMILTAAGWHSPGPLENCSVSTLRMTDGRSWSIESVGLAHFPTGTPLDGT
jgi:2,3-bisphosphoglycerate-dependent phosphoglycerate mutase